MTFKRNILIASLLFFCGIVSDAQIRIPTFDVELKINQTLMPGDGSYEGDVEFIETTNFYGGVHVQINQHIAVGGFYGRSFRGAMAVRYNEKNSKQDILLMQKGLDVRLSTGRAKNWRYYFAVSYSRFELVQEGESFRMADTFDAFGLNLGIMRRLSNNLYLNVIELGFKVRGFNESDRIWFAPSMDDNDVFFDAKMGLTYNIGKRK